MARTVKVNLALEVRDYVAGAGAATKATGLIETALGKVKGAATATADSVDTVTGEIADAGRESRRTGAALTDLAADATRLDQRIDAATTSVRELAREIARTGDEAARAELTKKLAGEQRGLRELTRLRRLIDAEAPEIAAGLGAQIIDGLGSTLSRAPLGPAGAALGAIVGVPLAGTVGALVAAGVVGGAGAGGVIGGLTLVSRDARVQAAGRSLADTVSGDLEDAASVFVQPALGGLDILREAWGAVDTDIRDAFEASAGYVEPLARGAASAAKGLSEGFKDAARVAGPVVDALSDGLADIGVAIGDELTDLSGEAQAAESAVRALSDGVVRTIHFVGGVADVLADVYEWWVRIGRVGTAAMDTVSGWIPVLGGKTQDAREHFDALVKALEETGDEGQDAGERTADGLAKIDGAASGATHEVELLHQMVRRLAGESLSARAAQRALEESIDAASESLAKNGATLDDNTAAGRANAAALDRIAADAVAAADAIAKTSGSQGEANRVLERGREQFIALADKMGLSAREARVLADQLFAIPSVTTTVSVDANPGKAAVRDFLRTYDKIKDKSITVHGHVRWTSSGLKVPGGTILEGFAGGGYIDGPGPRGVDSEVIAAAPGEYVLPADEVAAIGGPDGVERLREAIRGGATDGWRDTPIRTMPSPPLVLPATQAAGVSAADLAAAVRAALVGVTVQMDGRTVGYLTGREADILARA